MSSKNTANHRKEIVANQTKFKSTNNSVEFNNKKKSVITPRLNSISNLNLKNNNSNTNTNNNNNININNNNNNNGNSNKLEKKKNSSSASTVIKPSSSHKKTKSIGIQTNLINIEYENDINYPVDVSSEINRQLDEDINFLLTLKIDEHLSIEQISNLSS